jgi:hypothetical protein
MFKSNSNSGADTSGNHERAKHKVGLSIILAAASIALNVLLLQDLGAPSARESAPSAPATQSSTAGAIDNLPFGPPVGELPSLRKAPAVADEYRGVDVEDVPLDPVQSGSNG